MNPISAITRPVHDVTRAIVMPFKALFVVGLCALINLMTSPGHWWFKWVALGMGIAVVLSIGRALRTLVGAGVLAAIGLWLHRRFGTGAPRA